MMFDLRFFGQEALWGKKRTALFQTHNCQVFFQFFSTHSYVSLPGYTQIRDRGAQCAPPPSRPR